ncbi:MAG: hypothetical protein Q7U23_04420, partial [Methylococcales bacterium]|nr:hypothetical protein [Methylococcales bacterium]
FSLAFEAKASPTLYKNNDLQNSKFVLWIIFIILSQSRLRGNAVETRCVSHRSAVQRHSHAAHGNEKM